MNNNELKHYGVPGMKWGKRKVRSSSSSNSKSMKTSGKKPIDAQKKARTKKTLIGVGVGLTVAAASVAYIKNKDKIDGFIKSVTKKSVSEIDSLAKKGKDKVNSLTKSIKKNKPTQKDQAAVKRMKKAVKNRRLLSDVDLKNKIDRIKMERELKNLTADEISPGRKAVSEILSSSGKKVATTVLTGGTLYGIHAAISGVRDRKKAADYVAPKPKNK